MSSPPLFRTAAIDACGIQAPIRRQVELRAQSLRNELRKQRRLQQDDENVLRKKIARLLAEEEYVDQ